MYTEGQELYKAQKSVIELLRTFDCLPYNLLQKYLRQRNVSPYFNEREVLSEMIQQKRVSYSQEDKCYRAIKNIPKDTNKICCFATYIHFSKSYEEKLSKAKYPFDYIFEDNKVLYQLIDFEKDGRFKLNFRKNMEESTADTYEIMPVIMLINQGINVLMDTDEMGRYYLIPKDDYYVAFVHYAPKENELDDISVVSKKYKGGTFDEI